MNKILLTSVVLLGLAACATSSVQTDNEASRYDCDNGMQAAMSYQDATRTSGVLTLSRVVGGNVEARSITLARIAYPNGEALSNNDEQTQWVTVGSTVELTYPVDGVVRLFQCRPVSN
ncbi:MAG: hypothetical protein Q4G42_04595 [Neisseria sp.]|nr:hypothetical protein [Neisseria sp.]